MTTSTVAVRPCHGQIHDRDGVIREAAFAAANHAAGVHTALTALLAAREGVELAGAERHLRDELVALAIGFEPGAGNGASRQARIVAAQRALAAWDGELDVADDESNLDDDANLEVTFRRFGERWRADVYVRFHRVVTLRGSLDYCQRIALNPEFFAAAIQSQLAVMQPAETHARLIELGADVGAFWRVAGGGDRVPILREDFEGLLAESEGTRTRLLGKEPSRWA